MNKRNTQLALLLCTLALFGCSSTQQNQAGQSSGFKVPESYLNGKDDTVVISTEETLPDEEEFVHTDLAQIQNLEPLPRQQVNLRKAEKLSAPFSQEATLSLSVNEMPLNEFLHYALGELLSINYIIDKSVEPSKEKITLNIQENISPRRLMQLTSELLMEQEISINFNDGLYFINKPKLNKRAKNVVTAVGRELEDVPQTGQDILQIIPLKYGVKISIEKALRQLVGVQISTDADQSALFLQGKREEILRSLEFIHLLDAPSNRGKNIGLINLTYITSEEFTTQITTLLENEGIPIATNNAGSKNLVMVPIAQIGSIAVFAADKSLLDRVRYWAKLIDKPLQSVTKQYFMYHPQYARATDLGESLSALLGGTARANSQSSKSSTGNAPSNTRLTGVSSEDMTLVVDERSNAIIFYTSGNKYQALLPLIKKLDVLPRQVMLDITIAEVNLSDEFKHGVEWAFTQGELSMGTKDAFGVTGIGGFSLALNGADGSIKANFIETNDLIKVLSNPSLLVRDGVSANINVGSDISVVGETTEDPISGDRQTTSSEYRKTGVDVTVTPSINARGIVIMEISQTISNEVPDSSGASGNPNIFERGLKTEVVAQSGQTIILGGLISENTNQGDKKTPLLGDIPLVGHLFKSNGESTNRTELIMLITPKVIDRTDQWQEITDSFKQNLEYLTF
ncbi:secretin N-terminal domain-containing protein [Thalassotalea sp. 1_MG-2023]|uniref:secretin N-terminal domain-containing protein n=1 Tax=Thalassotalea sp. 1_MG-2023 TaxID=3062680 RepID=UPI0026E42B39|nr:secretin N-terminal domain-containing protein [Thalassotalea sp. 1_MG-2023]MDO6426503.1 secretin N-terminal domain-containing protein [Thalassotalea sp. 1_MG-2023]